MWIYITERGVKGKKRKDILAKTCIYIVKSTFLEVRCIILYKAGKKNPNCYVSVMDLTAFQ